MLENECNRWWTQEGGKGRTDTGTGVSPSLLYGLSDGMKCFGRR